MRCTRVRPCIIQLFLKNIYFRIFMFLRYFEISSHKSVQLYPGSIGGQLKSVARRANGVFFDSPFGEELPDFSDEENPHCSIFQGT